MNVYWFALGVMVILTLCKSSARWLVLTFTIGWAITDIIRWVQR